MWCGFCFFGQCRLLVFAVELVHEVLCVGLFFGFEICHIFVCYIIVVFVIVRGFEQHREKVFDRLTIGVPHCVHCSEHGFGDELVTQPAPSAVAPDDAQHLPIAQFIQELVRTDTYLAHDQLVDVAGGG